MLFWFSLVCHDFIIVKVHESPWVKVWRCCYINTADILQLLLCLYEEVCCHGDHAFKDGRYSALSETRPQPDTEQYFVPISESHTNKKILWHTHSLWIVLGLVYLRWQSRNCVTEEAKVWPVASHLCTACIGAELILIRSLYFHKVPLSHPLSSWGLDSRVPPPWQRYTRPGRNSTSSCQTPFSLRPHPAVTRLSLADQRTSAPPPPSS